MNYCLADNQIAIWSADFATQAFAIDICYALLNKQEQAQAARFKFTHLSQYYIQAHGLLRFLLATYLNENPAQLVFAKAAQGKPYLVDYPQVQFNISHSDSQLLIAVGKYAPLGVDIELIKPRKTLADLVLRCFAPCEQSYWQALPQEIQTKVFYQFWTRKEAFVKATGLGIALGLQHCVVNPIKPHYFLTVPAQCGKADAWYCTDLAINNDYSAALVTRSQRLQVVYHDLSALHLK